MDQYVATKLIQEECDYDEDFKKQVELLDQYDFSEFITDGRSLWNLRDVIEQKYDKHFWEKYGVYVFEDMSGEDTCNYFASRYNVWFQEYMDWVVRHDHGTNEKTRRRTEDSIREMEK